MNFNLDALVATSKDSGAVLDALLAASRDLLLPVDVDRELTELVASGFSPNDIVNRLSAYVRERVEDLSGEA